MCVKFFQSLFNPPTPQVPVYTPPTPAPIEDVAPEPSADAEEVKAAKEAERKRAAAAKGRSSTILTGLYNPQNEESGGRKTLLGR